MNCFKCVKYQYLDGHDVCSIGGSMKKDEKCRSFEAIVNEKNVEHPSWYNEDGAMECIEEMVLLYGYEETKSFCKLNAHKYRYRSPNKNGEEDRAKANNYIRIYEELCERQKNEKKSLVGGIPSVEIN